MSEAQVQNNLDKFHTMKEVTFRFKKDKLGNQRPSVKMQMPVPTAEGVANILTTGDAKQFALIEDAMYDVVRDVLGGFVAEESFDPATFDVSKLLWQAIANMPKEDRRSSTIPEEVWTGFLATYKEIMPSLTGKTPEQISNATEVLSRKLVPVKANKPILAKLKDQLGLFAAQPAAEPFTEVVEFLLRRAENYLAADDMAAIVGNL